MIKYHHVLPCVFSSCEEDESPLPFLHESRLQSVPLIPLFAWRKQPFLFHTQGDLFLYYASGGKSRKDFSPKV
jgi:hypothetical protein